MLYILGLVELILVGLLIRNRKDIALSLKLVAVLTITSLILMLEAVARQNVIYYLFTSLQVGTLNADFPTILGMVEEEPLCFKIVFYFLLLLTPVMFGGFVVSFFDGAIQSLTFGFMRKRSDTCCFSELNEHSLMLAESIVRAKKDTLIVFYDFQGDDDLKDRARKQLFLVLNDGFKKVIFTTRHQISYFFMKENQSCNISDGLALLEACKKDSRITSFLNMKMYIFSEDADSEDILNSTDKKGFLVSLMNRNEVIVNNLIFDHPFYEGLGESKELSILIAGSGPIALELARSAVWACQFGSDYTLKVTVVDEHASDVKRQLAYESPEYFNPKWQYSLNFYDAPLQSPELEQILSEHCTNTTYAAVCVDDDALSIQTALYLRRFFIRTDSGYRKEPFIAALVASKEKFRAVQELTAVNKEKISLKGWDIYSPKSENYAIVPFGYDDDLYSYENVLQNRTLKIALNCHTAYQYMFGDGADIPAEKLVESFNYSEIDKKSNRANGIHLKYKLHMLGYDLKDAAAASGEEVAAAADVLAELKEKLKDPVLLDYLGRLEHDRWTAFQSSQGWRSVSIDDARFYSSFTGSHKHLKAKLHPCICTYEELDEVIKVFDPHLKDYDVEFVKMLPCLLGLEESRVNTTGIRFICVKR